MTEVQEANFQKWMTALRCGKYRQAFSTYGRNGEMCALGVCRTIIPPCPGNASVIEHIESHVGLVRYGTRSVLVMNDDRRLPFPAIADEIEKHKSEWFE